MRLPPRVPVRLFVPWAIRGQFLVNRSIACSCCCWARGPTIYDDEQDGVLQRLHSIHIATAVFPSTEQPSVNKSIYIYIFCRSVGGNILPEQKPWVIKANSPEKPRSERSRGNGNSIHGTVLAQ